MKWIYRVVDAEGRCLYVGQTGTPKKRRSAHLSRWKGARFVLIRSCEEAEALRLEKQVTLAYKRRGQAQHCCHYPWRCPLAPMNDTAAAKLLYALETDALPAYAMVNGFEVGLMKTFGVWVLWIGGLDSNRTMRAINMRHLLEEWAHGKRRIKAVDWAGPGAGLLMKSR